MLDVPAEVQVMLDLTPEEMRELDAEFAKLPPTEQAQLEELSVEAGRAIARMNARLDETLAHLDRAFHNLGQIDSLTDAAARIFGSREAALAWLTRPHRRLGRRAPIDALLDEGGLHKVRRLLKAPVPRGPS